MMLNGAFIAIGLLVAAHLVADRQSQPRPTDVQTLLAKVKAKIDQVNDYTGDAQMDIAVSFMKVPPSPVKVYFRKPNDLRIIKQGGISILPKGGLNLNLRGVLKIGRAHV